MNFTTFLTVVVHATRHLLTSRQCCMTTVMTNVFSLPHHVHSFSSFPISLGTGASNKWTERHRAPLKLACFTGILNHFISTIATHGGFFTKDWNGGQERQVSTVPFPTNQILISCISERQTKLRAFVDKKCAVLPQACRDTWHFTQHGRLTRVIYLGKLFTMLKGSQMLTRRRNNSRGIACHTAVHI